MYTGTYISFFIYLQKKEWKEVIYVHDEKKLEGKVCGASYNKWSYGKSWCNGELVCDSLGLLLTDSLSCYFITRCYQCQWFFCRLVIGIYPAIRVLSIAFHPIQHIFNLTNSC